MVFGFSNLIFCSKGKRLFKKILNMTVKDGVPLKHQMGKMMVGGLAGLLATAAAERAYDKAFKLGK
jgi:hypothetical protein